MQLSNQIHSWNSGSNSSDSWPGLDSPLESYSYFCFLALTSGYCLGPENFAVPPHLSPHVLHRLPFETEALTIVCVINTLWRILDAVRSPKMLGDASPPLHCGVSQLRRVSRGEMRIYARLRRWAFYFCCFHIHSYRLVVSSLLLKISQYTFRRSFPFSCKYSFNPGIRANQRILADWNVLTF